MITTEQKRIVLAEVYPGEKWKQKVANMSDGQVIAVYYKFLSQNKIK